MRVDESPGAHTLSRSAPENGQQQVKPTPNKSHKEISGLRKCALTPVLVRLCDVQSSSTDPEMLGREGESRVPERSRVMQCGKKLN